MDSFNFYNPVKVIFGKGKIAMLSKEIPANAKILMTYGGGSIKQNGVYDQVMSALADYSVIEFGGIEANPHYETLMQAVEIVKKENIDFLLAVGGGSVIDGTKFIAAASVFEGEDPWDICAKYVPISDAIPLATVLTLPATGSEMNSNLVITKWETREKLAYNSDLLFPKFSVIDPRVTFSLPVRKVANGVIDSFIHVMEQYLTVPVNAPLQDRFSEAILKTLVEEGPKTYANPNDYDSRANLTWCATMALNSLISMGVPIDWATHKIGHEITAFRGLDHAVTLAIVLPSLLTALKDERREKLLQYGERIWNITEGSQDERIEAAIQKTREFFESLGVKTHLSDYNIDSEIVDMIVKRFESRGMKIAGLMPDVTIDKVEEILTMSL